MSNVNIVARPQDELFANFDCQSADLKAIADYIEDRKDVRWYPIHVFRIIPFLDGPSA